MFFRRRPPIRGRAATRPSVAAATFFIKGKGLVLLRMQTTVVTNNAQRHVGRPRSWLSDDITRRTTTTKPNRVPTSLPSALSSALSLGVLYRIADTLAKKPVTRTKELAVI